MRGTYVSIKAGKLTLSHDDGTADSEHALEPAATVTLNGNGCKPGDLLAGDRITLTGDPANNVAARRP